MRAVLLGLLALGFCAGCAGTHGRAVGRTASRRTSTSGPRSVMLLGCGHTRIGRARIDWARWSSGTVCYDLTRPGHPHPDGRDHFVACVRHLHADEIAFAVQPRSDRQQRVVGLKGPQVNKVIVLLAGHRKWVPPSRGGAFFGNAPPEEIRAVVKVTRRGGRRVFPVEPRT